MRGSSVFFAVFAVALVLAFPAWAKGADAKVGPKDGMTVESLPALGSPQVVETEKMADFSFPQDLEKAGNFAAADLEWQRIAHEADKADRAHALWQAGVLEVKLGNKTSAANTLRTFIEENPSHPMISQASYLFAQVADKPERQEVLRRFAELQNPDPWQEATLYQAVWEEAQTAGRVTQVYGLPKAVTLQRKLAFLNQQAASHKFAAMVFSVLPGAGHMVAGDYATGGLVLLVWTVLGLAFVSACRYRHYAYSFVFVLPFAALWLNAPFSAMDVADQASARERAAALAQWQEFQPQPPQIGPYQAEPQA